MEIILRETLDLFRSLLPAVIVSILAWYFFKHYFQQEIQRQKAVFQEQEQKMVLPNRLQAYERLCLLLERIVPENLVLRVNQPGLSVAQLHLALVQSVREEYEHNLSQQLYVSQGVWALVKNAKEQTIQLINSAGGALDAEQESVHLVQALLTAKVETDFKAIDLALHAVKNEFEEQYA